MAPLSSLTLKTRRVGKRSKARSNCSTKEWYRALLLHREGHSVGGGCSGDRGLERIIAISQGSGHLNRDLIETREGRRERRAEYRGIRGPDLDAHLAGIVDRVRWHLNAGGDWRGGGAGAGAPENQHVATVAVTATLVPLGVVTVTGTGPLPTSGACTLICPGLMK